MATAVGEAAATKSAPCAVAASACASGNGCGGWCEPAGDEGSWATMFATGAGDNEPLLRKLFRLFLLFTDELDNGKAMSCSSDSDGSSQWAAGRNATGKGDGSERSSAEADAAGDSPPQSAQNTVLRRHALTAAEVRILCALFAREIGLTELPSTYVGDSRADRTSYAQWTCAQCSCELRKAVPDYPQLYTFRDFIWALGRQFPHKELFEAAVDALLERIGSQVLRKGFIYVYRKSMLYRESCDMAWCMLLPGKLIFWPVDGGDPRKRTTSNRKEYVLTRASTVQVHGKERKDKERERFCWSVRLAEKRTLIFGSVDALDRYRWILAVQLSIDRVGQRGNLYAPLLNRLRSASSRPRPSAGYRRSAAYRPVSLVGGAFVRSVSPFAESADKLEAEIERRKELQRENKLLQELLDKERQTARDEEIVREVATRMLDEERTLREAAEARGRHQSAQLAAERVERERRDAELAGARMQLGKLADEHRRRVESDRLAAEHREAALAQLKREHESLMEQLSGKEQSSRQSTPTSKQHQQQQATATGGSGGRQCQSSDLAVFYVRPQSATSGTRSPPNDCLTSSTVSETSY